MYYIIMSDMTQDIVFKFIVFRCDIHNYVSNKEMNLYIHFRFARLMLAIFEPT